MLINIEDLKTHIAEGTMDAITDDDDTIAQTAIDTAISEAQGYCSLYDVAALFSGVPNDAVLKHHLKSMAKWHLMPLTNVNIDYEDAETRYTQAITWLRGVQSGKIVPPYWPPRVLPEGRDTYFHSTSRTPKRTNHY